MRPLPPVHTLWRAAAPALAALALLGGCDLVRDRVLPGDGIAAPPLDAPRVVNAWADSIFSVDVRSRVIVFDVRATTPTPCYDYAGAATEVVGTRVSVALRIRSTQEVCVTVVGHTRAPALAVRVPSAGRYTFAFWRGDGRPPLERVVDVR